jgi:MarR family transcriptional regulator for hemolysin
LADRLAVEGATMVAMIDRLVKAGFVVREPSSTDRRVKRIVLTPAGNELYQKVKAEAEAFRRESLRGVDQETLRIATEMLERLEEIVEAAR